MFLTQTASIVIFSLCSAGVSVVVSILIYRKLHKDKVTEMENTVASLKKNIEKQNEVIQNLTTLYDKAIEYDQHKTEFFSNITHELKTPLSVLLGTIQLMEKKGITCSGEPVRNVKYFQNIKINCYRLIRLVNNILDISRMEAGHARLMLTNCNIVYLVEEIVQSVVPYAEQKGITLSFDTETEEIITAIDMDKMERIILNLLSNAIKFTPSGGSVWITIHQKDSCLSISVKDTGPGISKDMLTQIFERFKQVGSPLTCEAEGCGIGLALVKSFTELHNGTVRVISEENKGSEFIVELPIRLYEGEKVQRMEQHFDHSKVIQSIHIEFSDLYSSSVKAAGNGG